MATTGSESNPSASEVHRVTPAVTRVMEWHRLHDGATPTEPMPPLTSPMPHSDALDREEPAFRDEPDLPDDAENKPERSATAKDAHAVAGPESVAGEEDPGAPLDDV